MVEESLILQGALLTFAISSILFGFSLLAVVTICKREYLEAFKTAFPQIAVAYVLLAASGMSVEEAREDGWLFNSVATGSVFTLPTNYVAHSFSELRPMISSSLWSILASMIVVLWVDLAAGTVVPMEATAGGELNMQSELTRAGVTNLACGATGGGVSYMSLSPTRLNEDAGGGSSRLSLVFSILTSSIWLFCGGEVLQFVPKPWAAGMLLHLAFGYILEGAWDPRDVLTRSEFIVIFVITIAYIAEGMIVSIVLGCILCCMYFTVRYAASPLVILPTDARSTQARTRQNSAAISKYYKDHTIIVVRTICSQLFFGTSASIKKAVKDISGGNTTALVFDLGSVEFSDVSALVAIGKIPGGIDQVGERKIELIICNVNEELKSQLKRSRDAHFIPKDTRIFSELDLGLQWAEDTCLLADGFAVNPSIKGSISEKKLVGEIFGDVKLAKLWRKIFIKIKVSCGETVYQEGTLAKGLYIVARGQLSLYSGAARIHTAIRGDKGPDIGIARRVGPYGVPNSPAAFRGARRTQVVQAGDVLCERAAYGACAHTRSLVADEDGTELLLLPRDRLLRLEHEEPSLAMKLHRALAMRASGISCEKAGISGRARIESVCSEGVNEDDDLISRLHGYGGGNSLLLVPSRRENLLAQPCTDGRMPPVSV
ncbi:hypothetical protein FOL47_011083 [Perkinsus chesapeaki]|uniref:Uncharacterized protein n=1 Tax=Perkinsus chesapeaki TaxID=330153 RepID=A0A7J6KZ38_PERCH|nr:hypothetical protein FOL47_011083 [Perkinsus chesapeaki]